MEDIIQFVSYLAVTSIAAERLTDIVKRTLLAKREVNGAVYQLVSGVFAAGVAYFSPPTVSFLKLSPIVMPVVVGLACSGGSSV